VWIATEFADVMMSSMKSKSVIEELQPCTR